METRLKTRWASSQGFSLIEVMIAVGVLTVGVLGVGAAMAAGMRNLGSSPGDVIATQKASQAVEAVFAARDSHKITWSQIRNIQGASGSDGGVFKDGPQALTAAGADGLVNTADDPTAIETIPLPGPDQTLGTSDDQSITLSGFTREISIRDVANENGQLKTITVTVIYKSGATTRTYTLTTLISAYA
jgi:type II secretory pathway pseudopilin PulG